MISVLKRFPILLTIPLLLFFWFVSTRYGWVGKSLLASPQEVWQVVIKAFHPTGQNEDLFHNAQDTLLRAFIGWGTSLLLGLVIGLLLGLNQVAYRAVEPVIEFIRAIPPIMAFPLLLIAFNFGTPAYIWAIAFGCLPIVILTVARGVQSLDHTRQELLVLHQVAKPIRLLASVVEILPSTFLAARVTFSFSLIVALVTEMVFTPRSGLGLGSLAKDSEISFDTPTFYACVLVLGIFGYGVNVLLRHAEWWLSGENTRQTKST